MPFRSQAQRGWMWANHPEMAREWQAATPKGAKLPEHVKKYEKGGAVMAKNWIQGAIKRPGQLHRDLGVPQGEKIPASKLSAAASRGGAVGRRARLAQTLKGFKSGGKVKSMPGMMMPASDNPHDTPAMERRERARGMST